MNPLSFLSPYLFWIKVGAIALVLTVVFGSGWKVRDYSCDAAQMRQERDVALAQVDALKAEAALLKTATENDQKTAAADAARVVELEAATSELESKAGSGVCFDANSADRLRKLWR